MENIEKKTPLNDLMDTIPTPSSESRSKRPTA